MSKNKSLGSEIYDGAGTFGHIEAWIGAIISTLIGIVLIVIGVIALNHKTKLTANTQGKIKDATCGDPYNDGNQQKYKCTVNVTYTVDNKEYNIIKNTDDDSKYFTGQMVTVYYNPSSPDKGELTSDNSKTLGIVFIIVGIVIPLFAWLWLWITYKSKFAAAAGGVAGAVNLIR
jgi:hypothetical protein